MSAVESWDRARLLQAVTETMGTGKDAARLVEQSMTLMDRWVSRGDGVAVYENHDLSSRHLGDRQYVSYGSPAAQLEVTEPPSTMPDIGSAINWRYQLVAVHGGPVANRAIAESIADEVFNPQ